MPDFADDGGRLFGDDATVPPVPEVSRESLLSVLSHELRTPLNNVCVGFQLLQFQLEDLLPDNAPRELMVVMERGLERLERAINNLILYAHLEGRVPDLLSPPTLVDVPQLLQEMGSLYGPAARQRSLVFRLEQDVLVPAIQTDRYKMMQILQHLLNNSIKFTDPGGSITLRCYQERSALVIEVQDTGIGIPKQVLPHIAVPFLQAESYLTRYYEGLGLGLTLARRLTELLGGTLTVTSAPAEGSCFTLRLPLIPAMAVSEQWIPSGGVDTKPFNGG